MIPIGAGDSPAAAAADLTWQLRLVGLARAAAAADLTRQLRLVGLALRNLLSCWVQHSPTSAPILGSVARRRLASLTHTNHN